MEVLQSYLLLIGTMIAIGYDNVVPDKQPEKWNLKVLFTIGAMLAAVACVSSLILLWFLLSSHEPGSVFQYLGLGGLSYGQVTTSVYLKVSVSDFLTLFTARCGDDFLWSSVPATILIIAAGCSLSISTILAITWPESKPDTICTSILHLGLLLRLVGLPGKNIFVGTFLIMLCSDVN